MTLSPTTVHFPYQDATGQPATAMLTLPASCKLYAFDDTPGHAVPTNNPGEFYNLLRLSFDWTANLTLTEGGKVVLTTSLFSLETHL